MPFSIRLSVSFKTADERGSLLSVEIQQPNKNQNFLQRLFLTENFGKDAKRFLNVFLDRLQGNVEAFGNLPVLQPVETTQNKNFAASFGQ